MTPPSPPSPRRPLTERRKATTRLEIARAAAELFAERGPDGTTAEEIADRAGVALRTFYRYFRNKRDAVGPLFAIGAERWRVRLTAVAPGLGPGPGPATGPELPELLERTLAEALSVPPGTSAEWLRWTRWLVRTALRDPALRAVWYRVNQESEEQLLPVLAALTGPDTEPLEVRLAAAVATDAVRIALETWAEADAPPLAGPGSPSELAVRCLRELMGGMRPLTGAGRATG
ncbi:TetR/AcrR family transcriptional regulator [Streptomyces sp. NPDC059881]|uniref:TetR/AcrR family transcriptional regulator n=1 Tax=Streptomyces sp. NPDC059881 TaxID=3346986 RepID=UPI00364D2A43